jgi:Fe-S-cluster formation regulator IscX/YfhJ
MAEENKKIVGFKKFSDIKSKSKIEEVNPSLNAKPMTDSDLPANPNLSKDSNKIEKPASRKNLMPQDQTVDLPSDEDEFENNIEEESDKTHESNVETFGKVAKFPKGVKASKAYNFMENVKISKKSIWYIMVEKYQELQLVKYNHKEGVDLEKFVNELKSYYLNKNRSNKKICEAIDKITVDGNDKYSTIKGIPHIEIDGKKIITKITEDLIRLLSK